MTAMTEARAGGTTQVTVPDIGDFKDVPIIEILVKEGDAINAEDPLLTLESDKATMEVPAPSSRHGGEDPGQGRRQGQRRHADPDVQGRRGRHDPAALPGHPAGAAAAAPAGGGGEREPAQPAQAATSADRGTGATTGARADFGNVHASPSVRRVARELGVDLTKLKGHRREGPRSPRTTC